MVTKKAVCVRDLPVSEIMRTNVETVTESTTVHELLKLFQVKHCTGFPVVSDEGEVIGVVSETDIIKDDAADGYKEAEDEVMRVNYSSDWDEPSSFVELESLDISPEKTVSDIMTPYVISVNAGMLVKDVAAKMSEEDVHRVLILDAQKKFRGMVTSMDIVRAVAGKSSGGC